MRSNPRVLLTTLFHSIFNLSVWGVFSAHVWHPCQYAQYDCKRWALILIGTFANWALSLFTLAMNCPIFTFISQASFCGLESMLPRRFAEVSHGILAPLCTMCLSCLKSIWSPKHMQTVFLALNDTSYSLPNSSDTFTNFDRPVYMWQKSIHLLKPWRDMVSRLTAPRGNHQKVFTQRTLCNVRK